MNKLRFLFKGLFFAFVLGLVFPSIVFALDTNSLEGTNLTSPGKVVTYDIKVNAEMTVEEYNVSLTYETDVLELVGIENKNNWKGSNSITSASPVSLNFSHENGVTGETVIATLKFNVKPNVTKVETLLSLSKATTVTQESQTINNLEEFSKTIAIRSTDNSLKDLKLNGKTVVNFSPSTYSYSVQVAAETTTANIDAILNSNTASFVEKYGSRSVPLEYGENVIEIQVMAASSDKKTYVINVTRLDNRGTNNDLKDIILDSGKIKMNFDKNVLEYNVKTHKLEDIKVEAFAVDSKATVKVEKPEKLVIGENVINIIVTSEDGKDKTYKVVLNNVDYDVDTSLKNIEIFGLDEEFKFDPAVFDYEIRYKSTYKDTVVIKPYLNTTDDDVKIDEPLLEKTSKSIEIGTVVQIRVYSNNGIESMYTISFVEDTRINFFFLLGIVILIVLAAIFVHMLIGLKKDKTKKKEKAKELEKTKKIKKINLDN